MVEGHATTPPLQVVSGPRKVTKCKVNGGNQLFVAVLYQYSLQLGVLAFARIGDVTAPRGASIIKEAVVKHLSYHESSALYCRETRQKIQKRFATVLSEETRVRIIISVRFRLNPGLSSLTSAEE